MERLAIDSTTGVLTFSYSFRILATGEVRSAEESILYTLLAALAGMIIEAGLAVDTWLGDWTGARFEPTSREIIPIGRLA